MTLWFLQDVKKEVYDDEDYEDPDDYEFKDYYLTPEEEENIPVVELHRRRKNLRNATERLCKRVAQEQALADLRESITCTATEQDSDADSQESYHRVLYMRDDEISDHEVSNSVPAVSG